MLFTEPAFLFGFLPLLLPVYFLAPRVCRNPILLIASLIFYSFGEPLLVLVLLGSCVWNWLCALAISNYRGERTRWWILSAAIGVNLLLLVVFKYAGFLVGATNAILAPLEPGFTIPNPGIPLPIGISFFTFQAISYVFDVYRQRVPAERNLLNVTLYVSLFPQLIAGPIVRYETVAREIRKRTPSLDQFGWGVQRFILGLGKKVLIANSMGRLADAAFDGDIGSLSTFAAWVGLLAYTLQIYYDFSGYSDMAIGIGRMLGFQFPENFNYPYISASVTEFWRRWHITLSTWFRDYLYIPLGGNRVSAVRTYGNLLLVFILCGLWHGAGMNFLVWGLLHGAFLVFERLISFKRPERLAALAHIYTLAAVMFGWVFFRAADLSKSISYLAALAGLNHAEHPKGLYDLNHVMIVLMLVGIIGATPIFPRLVAMIKSWREERAALGGLLDVVSVSFLLLVLFACMCQSALGTFNAFIYFRF